MPGEAIRARRPSRAVSMRATQTEREALRADWRRIADAPRDGVVVESAVLPAGRSAERARNAALSAIDSALDACAEARSGGC